MKHDLLKNIVYCWWTIRIDAKFLISLLVNIGVFYGFNAFLLLSI